MYSTYSRLEELKEIKKQRVLTEEELEELMYCKATCSSIDAEEKYLNGED